MTANTLRRKGSKAKASGVSCGDEGKDMDAAGASAAQAKRVNRAILYAFHHACDSKDLEAARQLLGILESAVTSRPHKSLFHDKCVDWLVAAHERMWNLRFPEGYWPASGIAFAQFLE